jgi:hypothetical protein
MAFLRAGSSRSRCHRGPAAACVAENPSNCLAITLSNGGAPAHPRAGASDHLDRHFDVVEPFLLEQIEDAAGQLLKQRFEARSFGGHPFQVAGFDEPDRNLGIIFGLHEG